MLKCEFPVATNVRAKMRCNDAFPFEGRRGADRLPRHLFEDVVWCGDVRPRGAGGPSAPEKKARVATDPVDASRLLEHPGGPKRFGSRLSR